MKLDIKFLFSDCDGRCLGFKNFVQKQSYLCLNDISWVIILLEKIEKIFNFRIELDPVGTGDVRSVQERSDGAELEGVSDE